MGVWVNAWVNGWVDSIMGVDAKKAPEGGRPSVCAAVLAVSSQ